MININKSVSSEKIKGIAFNLGADLCGIAPVNRFKDAPDGFKPNDIYEPAKSQII